MGGPKSRTSYTSTQRFHEKPFHSFPLREFTPPLTPSPCTVSISADSTNARRGKRLQICSGRTRRENPGTRPLWQRRRLQRPRILGEGKPYSSGKELGTDGIVAEVVSARLSVLSVTLRGQLCPSRGLPDQYRIAHTVSYLFRPTKRSQVRNK